MMKLYPVFVASLVSLWLITPFLVYADEDVQPEARVVALQSLTRDHDRTRSRVKALDFMVDKAPGVVGSPSLSALFAAASRGDKKALKELLKSDVGFLVQDKKFMKATLRVFGDGKLEKALRRHTIAAKPYFKLRINSVQRALSAGKLVIPPCFTREQEAKWRQKNAVVFAAALVGLAASEGPCRENQALLEMALKAYEKETGKALQGRVEVIAQVLIDRSMYPRDHSPICAHDGRGLEIRGLRVHCSNHPK